jgi:hypothetical protein
MMIRLASAPGAMRMRRFGKGVTVVAAVDGAEKISGRVVCVARGADVSRPCPGKLSCLCVSSKLQSMPAQCKLATLRYSFSSDPTLQ